MHDPAAVVFASTLGSLIVKPDGMAIFARWAGSAANGLVVSVIV
jgi:hypothetical protein